MKNKNINGIRRFLINCLTFSVMFIIVNDLIADDWQTGPGGSALPVAGRPYGWLPGPRRRSRPVSCTGPCGQTLCRERSSSGFQAMR